MCLLAQILGHSHTRVTEIYAHLTPEHLARARNMVSIAAPVMPRDEDITLTREGLHAEVWTTPLSTLARTYGISDVALGRICQKLSVPRPGRGYWAKVRGGENVEPTPLLPITSDQPTQHRIRRRPGASKESCSQPAEFAGTRERDDDTSNDG